MINPFSPQLLMASAGSGKTYQLTNRLIGLLAAGERPERILATTFTRRAAGEIFERVLRRLSKAVSDPQAAAELRQATCGLMRDTDHAAEILQRVTRAQHRFSICTLDSFWIKIVSCFSAECGIAPDWGVMDDSDRALLLEQVLDQIVAADDARPLVELFRRYHTSAAPQRFRQTLLSYFRNGYEIYRESSPAAWQVLREPLRRMPPACSEEQLFGLLKAAPLPRSKGGVNQHWQNGIRGVLKLLEERDWKKLLKANFVLGAVDGKSYQSQPYPPETAAALSAVYQTTCRNLLAVMADRSEAAYALFSTFDRYYRRAVAGSHRLLFNDIKRLLSDSAALGALDAVYYRLDSRVRHLLLDEFQDTSREEWRLLKPIADELLAYADNEHSFLCVGDVKQAIYEWRGGVADVLYAVADEYPQIEKTPLVTSYRSSTAVIDTVNMLFANLPEAPEIQEYLPTVKEWCRGFAAHTTAKKGLPGYCRFSVANPDPQLRRGDAALREAAKLAVELHSAAPHLEVCVLVRRNVEVAQCKFEISRIDPQLHVSGEGGNPLSDSGAVSAILSLLTLADSPDDDVAAYHVRRSPLGELFGLTPHDSSSGSAERVSLEVRRDIQQCGLGAWIGRVSESISSSCSEFDRLRLRGLFEAALRREEDFKGRRLHHFVRWIRQTGMAVRGCSAKVQVCTVHKSKGLEFDIVIIPGLGSSCVKSEVNRMMYMRERQLEPISAAMPSTVSGMRRAFPEIDRVARSMESRSLSGELSVLYVALTRAKHALYLIADADPALSYGRPRGCKVSLESILRSTLAGSKGGVAAGEILYERGDPQWMSGLSQPVEAVCATELKRTVRAPGRKMRSVPIVAPSSLHAGKGLFRFSRARQEARRRGTRLHALLQKIEWLDGAQEAGDAELLNLQESLRQGECARYFLREEYDQRGWEDTQLHRELPFAVRIDDSIARGAVDRLVLRRNQSTIIEAQIIDFKTDRVATPQELAQAVERYRPQMLMYRRAVAALYNLKLEMVEAVLLFVECGQAVHLERDAG